MKSSRFFMPRVVALVFVTTSAAFAQGVYWETTVTGGPAGEQFSRSYMMPGFLKVARKSFSKTAQKSDEFSAMIVNLEKKLIITVNDKEKTYSETSFDDMEARMAQISKEATAKDEEVQQQLKAMPEEKRKMIEKMMGPMAGGTGPIEVKTSAEKKTILGYPCSKTEVVQDGKTVMSIWSTKAVKGFEALRADWKQFSQRMTAQIPGRFGKMIADGMKKVEGFPMETDMGTIVSTATKVETRAIPASTFDVPAGYKKVEDNIFGKKEN
jgi:hypothetical protein